MGFVNYCAGATTAASRERKSLYALLSLVTILLLACNGAISIFSLRLPFPPKTPASFSPENVVTGKSRRALISAASPRKLSPSSLMYAVKPDTHFRFSRKNRNLVAFKNTAAAALAARRRKQRSLTIRAMGSGYRSNPQFSTRAKGFLRENSCKLRFFMTWISSVESFGSRETSAMESLFRAHPTGCLIIVSNSIDSVKGKRKILKPFLEKGLKITALAPDFNYLFKNTSAQGWFDRLTKGDVNPGEISIGQNLSNLLRLGLLYRFGGVYVDTDVIILKSFSGLRNVIGAQTMNLETRNWSRLNNAVMVFDKGHPLVRKFIEEFALTFDGNKWGHNGPYLVSRVVAREGCGGATVLPPGAFYPVGWGRIGGLFEGGRNETHVNWAAERAEEIRMGSYGVHLWNKQSRRMEIGEGSIVQVLMRGTCVFCNSSSP
ncbi:hypothetical protein DM860_002959 [Cuscuta australis]|uniref:Alpha 1,4-glycosyltransferase domain-containing protein n=1 Tax=Cuscuta australis TaxID=267555 RepID=A0A328D1Q7_9ASTE|nr:hypothetical protein DM860_002959 [Cuscuta australis]